MERLKINQQYDFRKMKKLGSGSFGVTYVGKNVDKKYYTIKLIPITELNAADTQTEIDALIALSKDPHCYRFLECFVAAYQGFLNEENTVVIISQYINGQTLASIVESYYNRASYMPFNTLWRYMMEIALAVSYIHSMGYAHRDLHPGNILVESETGNIKLIDFGLACKISCNNTVKGAVKWLPPEAFSPNYSTDIRTAQLHDMWSLGVTFYMMANLILPFKYNGDLCTPIKMYYKTGNVSIDNWLYFIIISLLECNMYNRLSANNLVRYLQHLS